MLNLIKLSYGSNSRFFNETLFDGKLPDCVLTVQRGKNYLGFFAPRRWKNNDGRFAHEIAMNTSYFNERTLIQILQTLVHEQVHLWQQEFGKPSRTGYHNKEWADKMESIGLMPSSTHRPGGSRTGQNMGDYPIAGGLFERSCIKLMESGFLIHWVDRSIMRASVSAIDHLIKQLDVGTTDSSNNQADDKDAINTILNQPLIHLIQGFEPIAPAKTADPSKVKYTCVCGYNVWGKPKLKLLCQECDQAYVSSWVEELDITLDIR